MSEEDKAEISEKEVDKLFRSRVCYIAHYKLGKSIKKWILPETNHDIPMKEFKNILLMYNIIKNKDFCGGFYGKKEREKESREESHYI